LKDHAWDAAVDTAMLARRSPERFETIREVYGYAKSVAIHAAIRTRTQEVARQGAADHLRDQPAIQSLEDTAITREEVERALRALPNHLQRTVVAVKVFGESTVEVAKAEGVAGQTVTNRVHQAISLMRAEVAESEDE
jgi:DNA-directed RNA polymerase specialized sigma24 family protein